MQTNPPDDWLKTELARDSQKRTRLVDFLFCITCSLENNAFSVLHYVIKVTYTILYVELPQTFAHAALLGCASPFLSLLVRNYCKTEFVYNGSDVE